VKHDWPQQWPALFPVILDMFNSNDRHPHEQHHHDSSHVAFALKFFSLASEHLDSEPFVPLIPFLFPHLERIFLSHDDTGSDQNANDASQQDLRRRHRLDTIRFKVHVVSIVQTCLTMIGVLAQSGDIDARNVLHAHMSPWIDRFLAVLSSSSWPSSSSSFSSSSFSVLLILPVLRALSAFILEWPKDMRSFIPAILPSVRVS
jgi:hypothetical protein